MASIKDYVEVDFDRFNEEYKVEYKSSNEDVLKVDDNKIYAVGVGHAGWRGTYGKICEETLKSMQENYNTNPENVIAIIGPSIGSCCYEVSYDLIDKLKNFFQMLMKKYMK